VARCAIQLTDEKLSASHRIAIGDGMKSFEARNDRVDLFTWESGCGK
jgi:hypothetical protein